MVRLYQGGPGGNSQKGAFMRSHSPLHIGDTIGLYVAVGVAVLAGVVMARPGDIAPYKPPILESTGQ